MASPRNATTDGKGRTYLWPPTGERFTSVTTILSAGVPKPALLNWAPKMVAEFVAKEYARLEPLLKSGNDFDQIEAISTMKNAPWRDRDAAANKGTQVHDFAEQITLYPERQHDIPPALKGHVDSFKRFLDEWQPDYEATEMTVYNRTDHYAGTLDAIAHLPGLGLCLIDYKTNRSGIFGDIALQLAAYRHAEFIGLPDDTEVPMYPVDNCIGLHIGPDGYKVIPVDTGPDIFAYFLHALEMAKWAEDVSKNVLGAPRKAPKR